MPKPNSLSSNCHVKLFLPLSTLSIGIHKRCSAWNSQEFQRPQRKRELCLSVPTIQTECGPELMSTFYPCIYASSEGINRQQIASSIDQKGERSVELSKQNVETLHWLKIKDQIEELSRCHRLSMMIRQQEKFLSPVQFNLRPESRIQSTAVLFISPKQRENVRQWRFQLLTEKGTV